MILFGPRYQGLLDDIYNNGVLAEGLLAVSAPADRHRPVVGAQGLLDLLRARAGAHRGKGPRLGKGRRGHTAKSLDQLEHR